LKVKQRAEMEGTEFNIYGTISNNKKQKAATSAPTAKQVVSSIAESSTMATVAIYSSKK